MRNICIALLIMIGLSACNPSKNKKVDQATIGFQTDDSSKLYFKNVRSAYYDVEVMEEAKLEIYRLKSRVKESQSPLLNLSIVNNWRYDEAYILLEPNEAAGSITDLQVQWESQDGSSGTIIPEGGNKKNQLDFAAKIYEHIQDDDSLFLLRGNEKLELLKETKEREAFRIAMFDYFRLTLAY